VLTVAPSCPAARPIVPARRARVEGVALLVWVVLVVVAVVWGSLRVADAGVGLRAAPLAARWRWHAGWRLVPAAVVGLAVVRWGPARAARLRIPRLAVATGAAAVAWTVALAAADGWDRLTAPLTTRHEYEPYASRVSGIGALVRGYTSHLDAAPVHVQGHPPGPVVLAWALDRVGLGGAGWLAAASLACWGVAAAAAVLAVRAVAGDGAARRAAPALAVLPAAVWAGTSLDAMFAGVVAVAVALAAVATTRQERAGGVRLAVASGAVLGLALLMTYGAALFVVITAVVIAAVAPADRRAPSLVAFGAGLAAVLGLAAVAGFWWPAGLAATDGRYWAGIGAVRPGLYTTVAGNPAALALATGPAVAVGLAGVLLALCRRARGTGTAALLPLLALAAVVVADLSQMSRGEVERIWLPFVPWLALAAPGHRRALLAAQVALGLGLQAAVRSPW
jgi:methylthioxylose transferase